MSGAAGGTLRIIGGQWRGRKFRFPDADGLRPTPDRVRETLFNWLSMDIAGARCLDLFAGSGALGLEALSRGAGHCTFVDASEPAMRAIRAHLEALANDPGPGTTRCERIDAERFLQQGDASPFDIVFLDPPFAAGLLQASCQALEAGGWLAPRASIYLECARRDDELTPPANWHCHRDKTAGDVRYRLFHRT